MATISSSNFTCMEMLKLNEQVETAGKHLQISGHPWLNTTSIFVGTPKTGTLS